MNLGDIVESQGAPHRCVRICRQISLRRYPGTEELYTQEETVHELKNCRTGRVTFVLTEVSVQDFVNPEGVTDVTAFTIKEDHGT